VAAAGAATGDRVVILNELAAEASEDGRTADQACPLLLADAGRRTPDPSAVRSNVAADFDVTASGKLTMIARPNQIAEEKGGEKSVREIDEEGSRLRVQVQGGTESLCFSTGIAALPLPYC